MPTPCPPSILDRIPALSQLGPGDRAELGSICRLRQLEAGRVFAEGGVPGQEVGFILAGALGMTRSGHDGRGHVVGLLLAGDFFGQLTEDPPGFRLEVLETTSVAVFDRAAFSALLHRRPALERVLMTELLDELDAARASILMLSGHRTTERIAFFLLSLARRSDPAHVPRRLAMLEIPVGRRALARYLGTRPETLSRAYHALAEGGLIALVGDRHVELRDPAGLAEVAGIDLDEPPRRSPRGPLR